MKTLEKYLIVIAGPTAVGKTKLAIQLAKHYDSVIISADSRQFYREMNIGTAKPDENDLKEVQHYFVNNKNVDELYGAGHFAADVLQLLDTLFKEHQVVFMVGGSGLYINAVLNGVDDFAEVPPEVRKKLNADFEKKGKDWLREELKKRDPEYYEIVDKDNPQRIIRALEVCLHSGLPYSSFLKKEKSKRNFSPVRIMINMPREELYKRINQRVDEMMENGLLEEVKDLAEHKHDNALKTVGYRELYEYLEGKSDLKVAVEKIKQHTRNYAKRQLTWFRNQDDFEEFNSTDIEKIKAYIDLIVSHG